MTSFTAPTPKGSACRRPGLCETHNVSRTPVRLALRLLEREGIIHRCEGRGYRIESPTIADILQAVQVRGHLESLAARLMAQTSDRAASAARDGTGDRRQSTV